MTNARRDGLYLFLLGAAIFLLLGGVLEKISSVPMIDFKVVYHSARCLLHHGDPYRPMDVLRAYKIEGGDRLLDQDKYREILTRYMYLPTAFAVTVPLAALGFGIAHVFWMALVAGGLIFAAFLVWNLGAEYAPVVSGALVGLLLANSELLIVTGNAASIAVSTCIVAVWCFFRERFAALGVVCLSVSLALKPHDTGLVWLYFLLAGPPYRKRALQALAVFAAMSLPCFLWVAHLSPHWLGELNANLATFSAHGGLNDPSAASAGAHGIGMMINLQTALSFFRDDPRFYNPATYLMIGALLLVWALVTLRSRVTPARTWMALASVAALSLLPIYHRQHDAVLLLLAVPACCMLWARSGAAARTALAVTAAAFVITGELTWVIILGILNNLPPAASVLEVTIVTAVQVLPVPLTMLAMGLFYLRMYARNGLSSMTAEMPESVEELKSGN